MVRKQNTTSEQKIVMTKIVALNENRQKCCDELIELRKFMAEQCGTCESKVLTSQVVKTIAFSPPEDVISSIKTPGLAHRRP